MMDEQNNNPSEGQNQQQDFQNNQGQNPEANNQTYYQQNPNGNMNGTPPPNANDQTYYQQNPNGNPYYQQNNNQQQYQQNPNNQQYQQPNQNFQQGYNPNFDPNHPNFQQGYSYKSKVAAGLLGIFLGSFGVHNFYLGFTGKAIAQLLITVLTCGIGAAVSSIWGLIEGILILTGSINVDANNMPLRD